MDIWIALGQAVWFIWPAYCANTFPVIVRGRMPLDFGRKLGNSRLFGGSKTIEGTAFGIFFGILVGLVQMQVFYYIPSYIGVYHHTVPVLILMGMGALFGDIAGSFIKRRLGMKPGDPAIIMDQLGFLVFALLFAGFLYVPSIEVIIVLLILTPIIHLATNIFGYICRIKSHPW